MIDPGEVKIIMPKRKRNMALREALAKSHTAVLEAKRQAPLTWPPVEFLSFAMYQGKEGVEYHVTYVDRTIESYLYYSKGYHLRMIQMPDVHILQDIAFETFDEISKILLEHSISVDGGWQPYPDKLQRMKRRLPLDIKEGE